MYRIHFLSLLGARGQSTDAAAEVVSQPGDDFCELYARLVAVGLVNIETASAGSVADAEGLAADLAAKGAVARADLQAVAPPEPLGYLNSLEDSDARGAAGDWAALDESMASLISLNDWAIGNWPGEYTPVFEQYKTIIG